MKKYFFLVICIGLLHCSFLFAQEPVRPIGINLNNVSPWDPQIMFVDVMNQSHPWFVQDIEGEQFSIDSVTVPVGQNGYPAFVPFTQGSDSFRVHTFMLSSHQHPYPEGEDTLTFDGTGEIALDYDVEPVSFTQPDTPHTFTPTPTNLGIDLAIIRSDSSDPIRNIRVVLPGFYETSELQPFHPKALELLLNFSMIRFMLTQETLETEIRDWSERTTPDSNTQFDVPGGGIAVEYIAALCNTLNADAWVNIPALANDEYIHEFARVIRDSLNHELRIYVEYGNENWNSNYISSNYVRNMGIAQGLDTDTTLAGYKYTAKRSIEIFEIFNEEFTDDTRIIKVFAGHSGLPFVAEVMLAASLDPTLNPNQIGVDALAIAPYFGWELSWRLHQNGGVNNLTGESLIDSLEQIMAAEITEIVTAHKVLAEQYGLDLIAYEGGQGIEAFENSPQNYIDAMHSINRNPRMQTLYCDFYDIWYQNGGDIFTSFVFITPYDHNLAYGLLEHLEQDPTTSPKWMAHVNCVFPKTTGIARYRDTIPNTTLLQQNHPNPFNPATVIQYEVMQKGLATLTIYNPLGEKIRTLVQENLKPGNYSVVWDGKTSSGRLMSSGIYFYQLRVGNFLETKKMILVR